MNNLTVPEIKQKIKNERMFAQYFYTPLCGTCQVAGKMLEVVEKLPTDYSFGKADLNYMPEMAEEYRIESVPCLLLFENGVLKDRIYAFQSVPSLYERLLS